MSEMLIKTPEYKFRYDTVIGDNLVLCSLLKNGEWFIERMFEEDGYRWIILKK